MAKKIKNTVPAEAAPKFSVEELKTGGFVIARMAEELSFAGKSLIFEATNEPADPFETSEEATAAMEKYIQECTQGGGSDQSGGDVPEVEEKDFVVAVSIHKEIKVKAVDKKDAIEKLKVLPFGDHVGWENATPREV